MNRRWFELGRPEYDRLELRLRPRWKLLGRMHVIIADRVIVDHDRCRFTVLMATERDGVFHAGLFDGLDPCRGLDQHRNTHRDEMAHAYLRI